MRKICVECPGSDCVLWHLISLHFSPMASHFPQPLPPLPKPPGRGRFFRVGSFFFSRLWKLEIVVEIAQLKIVTQIFSVGIVFLPNMFNQEYLN